MRFRAQIALYKTALSCWNIMYKSALSCRNILYKSAF